MHDSNVRATRGVPLTIMRRACSCSEGLQWEVLARTDYWTRRQDVRLRKVALQATAYLLGHGVISGVIAGTCTLQMRVTAACLNYLGLDHHKLVPLARVALARPKALRSKRSVSAVPP